MAILNKILVHVPSNLCDGFKAKYINGTDNSYDDKIVFLEKTQEIFSKGKLYGIVEAKLPTVTAGTGIEVTSSKDGNGKTTYTVSQNFDFDSLSEDFKLKMLQYVISNWNTETGEQGLILD